MTRTSPWENGSDHRPLIYFSAARHVLFIYFFLFFFLPVSFDIFFFLALRFVETTKINFGFCVPSGNRTNARTSSPADLSLYLSERFTIKEVIYICNVTYMYFFDDEHTTKLIDFLHIFFFYSFIYIYLFYPSPSGVYGRIRFP